MTVNPKVMRLQSNEWTWAHVLSKSDFATLRMKLGNRFNNHAEAFADALEYMEATND